MSRPTERLDLYAVSLHPARVEWVDGFGGLDAALEHLRSHPDERCYCLTNVASAIRAVAFFSNGNLLLLTSGGEASITMQEPSC